MSTGYEVEFVGNFPELDLLKPVSGYIDVRVLLLAWTGDYPAQCEVGKFINGGILACRRDKLKGEKKKYNLLQLETGYHESFVTFWLSSGI